MPSRALCLGSGVVALALAVACTPLHRLELVPPAVATAPGQVEARVVAVSSDSAPAWFAAYEVELRNPAAASVDIDLAAARLALVSMIDESVVSAIPIDGGAGPTPGTRAKNPTPPGHVTVGPGETRTVWIAFGGALDPRAKVLRRQTLSLPGGVDVVLDERTAAHPFGTRAYRGKRFALGGLGRSGLELGSGHVGVAVPYDIGGTVLLGDVRFDVHAGHRIFDESAAGTITRTGAFAAGPGVTWQLPIPLGIYGEADYERLAPPNVPRSNAAVIGAGITIPAWRTLGAYGNWRVPIWALRVGWVETFANGGSSAALRIGVEFSPTWVW